MARKTRKLNTSQLPKRKSVVTAPRNLAKVGRNEPCPCGSGKKYKDCHRSEGQTFLEKLAREEDQQLAREKRRQMKEAGVPWYRRLFVS